MARGPVEVQAACEKALAQLADAFASSTVTGSLEEWAGAVGSLQRVIDVASAAQDAAIAQVAAIEPEAREDGTWGESHRALGHMALDAPAVVSGVLKVSAAWAERRVRTAVRLAADGPAGADTETGLRGLHEAMAAGRLDGYRASVLAEELAEAPPEVAATVVAALEPYVESEDAGQLRRRCRRALARISPDLLRQRAQRARANAGLRRWADEPGVDRWEGTFPSEDAALAWAAIDALAQRYVAQSRCPTIERARAKALTDLVAGNATVETVLTVTVPAPALPELAPTTTPEGSSATVPGPEVDLVELGGLRAGDPVLAPRAWVSAAARDPGTVLRFAPCHPVTGALLDDAAAYPRPDRVAVSTADPDDVADSTLRPTPATAGTAVGTPTGTDASDGGPHVAGSTSPTPPVSSAPDRYRPRDRLAHLVRVRDRSCRFPGCTVAAVFCDLDHVRPWPTGATSAENLMCLCRRHHRVKQRPGWRVVLAADGTATWTDPTGRVRTTAPVDALRTTVLPGAAATPEVPHSTSRARTVLPDGPHSDLEFHLEHLGAAGRTFPATRRDTRGRHTGLAGKPRGRRPGASGPQHVHLFWPVAVIRIPEAQFSPGHGTTCRPWHRTSRHREHSGDEDLPPPF